MKIFTKSLLMLSVSCFCMTLFSACDTNYYTQRSALDVPAVTLSTDNAGRFAYETILYTTDFENLPSSNFNIRSIDLSASDLWVDGGRFFRAGDKINLTLANSRGRSLNIVLEVNNQGIAHISDEDTSYHTFISNMMNSVVKHGDVTLAVEGRITSSSGAAVSNVTFMFEILNNVDLQVQN